MNFKGLDVFVFVSEWQRTNSDDRGGRNGKMESETCGAERLDTCLLFQQKCLFRNPLETSWDICILFRNEL